MVKVIATSKGYFGGQVREFGASFDVPDDLWADAKKRPSWAKIDPGHTVASRSSVAAAPAVSAVEPGGPVTIPNDWRTLSAVERKALAKAISGQAAPNVGEADKVIAAYVASVEHPPAFGDAPAPVVLGNGLQQALGGVQPDWVAPGAGGAAMVQE